MKDESMSEANQQQRKQEDEQQALDAFDNFVRTTFSSQVVQSAGSAKLSYELVVVSMSPVLWYSCDVLGSIGDIPFSHVVREAVFEYGAIALLAIPATHRILCHILPALDRATNAPARPLLDKVIAPFRVALVSGLLFCSWFPLKQLDTRLSILPILSYTAALGFFTFILYRKPQWLWLKAASN